MSIPVIKVAVMLNSETGERETLIFHHCACAISATDKTKISQLKCCFQS